MQTPYVWKAIHCLELFSDRERLQLFSFLFTGMRFDPAVMARVQNKEHLAAQQRMISSVVHGLASPFLGSSSTSCRGRVGKHMRKGSSLCTSQSASILETQLQVGLFQPKVLVVEDPMVMVDFTREVVLLQVKLACRSIRENGRQ